MAIAFPLPVSLNSGCPSFSVLWRGRILWSEGLCCFGGKSQGQGDLKERDPISFKWRETKRDPRDLNHLLRGVAEAPMRDIRGE